MIEPCKNDDVIESKTSSFGHNQDNFVIEGELTVTITLDEYRDLVKANAISQEKIDKANSEKYEVQKEKEKLEKQVSVLTELLENRKSEPEAESKPEAESEDEDADD